MASIRVKFRNSSIEGKEGIIFYQIIHDRTVRQISTAHHILPSEWNDKKSIIVSQQESERAEITKKTAENIRMDMARFNRIIATHESNGQKYTADDIAAAFKKYMQNYSLTEYMSALIHKFELSGKTRTAETYTSTLKSFRLYLNNKDIMLDSLNSGTMEAYESFLQQKGVVPNTISFYMRILRATYNRAVDEGAIEDCKPFRHVYTGIERTVKRALPLRSIKKIKSLDLSYRPAADYARDMFLLSFYLRGMSFIDMAFLKKSDLKNGYISYRRRKTRQALSIKWTDEMQAILDKYPDNSTPYLLPIIRNSNKTERKIYRNMSYNINRNLKTVARIADINVRLTMYCARHSWASAAKTAGIPITVIRDGMGHLSETTTQIYLASLDTNAVDRANALILRRI